MAKLESPLPASLPAGTGTAVFCCGACFHRRNDVAGLELVVDGTRHRVDAACMPRPDLPGAFRSGFWGTVPVPARGQGTVEIGLAVRLTRGDEDLVALGSIPVVERARSTGTLDPGLIAVCMATYEPDLTLFTVQVQSLRAQTDDNWLCVISDDCSSPERFAQIEAVIAGDERFTVSRSERRLGFYRNFERALRMAPAEAELIALCDQDDRWHPDKLATLRDELGAAQLV